MCPYIYDGRYLRLPAYPIFYGIGLCLAGAIVVIILNESLRCKRVATMLLCLSVITLIGGRMFYYVIESSAEAGAWTGFWNFKAGGEALFGSLMLGVPAAFVLCKLMKVPFFEVCDAAAVGIPVGLVIGRIGCLCVGCCHGKVTGLPWGVRFPKHVDMNGVAQGSAAFLEQLRRGLVVTTDSESLPVHPTQVYEAFLCACIAIAIMLLKRRRLCTDYLLMVCIVLYVCGRFWLEFFRTEPKVIGWLTVYQVMCMCIAISAAGAVIVRSRARNRLRKTPLA